MSKDDNKGGFGSSRWGGGSRERQAEEKVVPLTRRAKPEEREAYVAFDVREHANRLHIRRATEPRGFRTITICSISAMTISTSRPSS